jgi:agmatine/peptidylarginine deiminase
MLCARFVSGAALVLSVSAGLSAQALEEPIRVGDQLVYPEGAQIPRSLTPIERAYLQQFPLSELTRSTPPPTGPVHCVAEYEPMQAILLAWEGYSTIQRQMIDEITTTGDADAWIVVDSTYERNNVTNTLSSYGIDMNRVRFIVRGTDTVWIRDYGPRYIYEGDCRAIVDHTYNRPRPNDDALNGYLGPHVGHEVYEIPLVHGGGNYHLNALGSAHATRLINNENPSLTEQQIIDYWQDYQNVLTTLWTPFPSYVDSTQHIDMWMQIIGDTNIIISDWPYDSGSTQDQICDNAAAHFAGLGWTVTRVPARDTGWTHYTYTNMVVCNDLVLLPYYTNSSVMQHNSEALAAVQSAVPDKTVVQINCEAIVSAAGVMHCIVMHVPEPVNGENPSVYLREPNGGATYDPGEQVEIRWISDDDVEVTEIDILLSTNGGVSFDTTIATGTADDGSFLWTVPDVDTTQGRLRLVAHDADGNTGFDDGDGDFTINGTQPDCPGDLDGDLDVDQADLGALLGSYGQDAGGDIDGDGDTDQADLGALLGNYGADCS